MQTQTLFDIAPTGKLLTRSEVAKQEETRRLAIAKEAFDHQTEKFKDAFEAYLESYLHWNKGKRFVFPDITEKYASFKSQPQPLKDFRCVGYLAIKYQKLGIIKQVDTQKDKKSKRIIPVYEIVGVIR